MPRRSPSIASTSKRIVVSAVVTPLLVLAGWLLASPELAADRLTFDVLFGDAPFGRLPSQLRWSPGGGLLGYVWDDGSGDALWVLDVGSGEHRAVLRAEPDAEDGLGLSAYHWSPSEDKLLLESRGDLRLLDLGDLGLHRFPETEAIERIPAFSPDGGRVAFVRDEDLHVVELMSGRESMLTTDGKDDETINGITDWVYWEEIWGRRATGFWWSPDGGKIAFYQFDETPVASYALVDFQGVPYPEVEWQKYPKAGTENPVVRIGVVDVESGRTTWLDTGGDPDVYLARVDWRPDGKLAVQRLNRDQDRLDLLLCDAGDGACTTLLTESWPTWVNLHRDLRFLRDGGFIWSSESSGHRRLYLHAADGRRIRSLSSDGWIVTALDAVNEEEGWLVYTAHRAGVLGAKDRAVVRGSLSGEEVRLLSGEEGWNSAQVAPAGGVWLHRWSDANRPAQMALLSFEGETVAELPSTPGEVDPEGMPQWEFLTIPGADGSELPAALLRGVPAGSERQPAIMYHYGGPGSQVVSNVWSSRGPWHKMMAQRGYTVLKVDNPGSRFFGKRGQDLLHRRFGAVNLEAQLAGVEFLKSLGTVDPARIGLWGWSGGGANTLYSVLNSPGTWGAAVAGAPVTDWRLYDTIWTERYLDHPEDNPEGYEQSSAVTHADRLADPLLIVHGTADDNVHPQNTLSLVYRFVQAGVPFEQAIYPRQKHGFRGRAARHVYERITEFFDRHLLSGSASD